MKGFVLFIAVVYTSVLGAMQVPGELLVKLKNNRHVTAVLQTLSGNELGKLSLSQKIGEKTYLLNFSADVGEVAASAWLRAHSSAVEWAHPNYLIQNFAKQSRSNDPLYKELWNLKRIDMEKAWGLGKGSKKIVVANIDTGIDYLHEDLRDNLWQNPDPNAADKFGYDFAQNDPDPMDVNEHGTHTAGIIGATGNNGKGIVGVSQQISILTVKFIHGTFGSTAAAIQSIDYAIKHGARIINASWGGYSEEEAENQGLIEAIERAEKANILFVAASGNDGGDNDKRPMFPAGLNNPNIISVASVNERGKKSFFSNYGLTTVDLGAPGGGVLSTAMNNRYKKFAGTSMAAPHVSGLAALMLSVNPQLTYQQLKDILMRTVDPMTTLQGKCVTGGEINAFRAVQEAVKL